MAGLALLCGAAFSWLLVRWVKRKIGGAANQLGGLRLKSRAPRTL